MEGKNTHFLFSESPVEGVDTYITESSETWALVDVFRLSIKEQVVKSKENQEGAFEFSL